ncbi:MAG: ABC transporter permease subunit [Clostridiales bacterium]
MELANKKNLPNLKNDVEPPEKKEQSLIVKRLYKYRYFYLMLLPTIIFFVIFHYLPMLGIAYSFFDMGIFGDLEFIGLDNFQRLFETSDFWIAFKNTLILSLFNIFLNMVITVGFALLLNEIRVKIYKKFIQTMIYIPHFLSWVVVAAIFTLLLSENFGIVNAVIDKLGGEKVYFLVKEEWWRPIFLGILRWKDTGYATIIFLAALANINPDLYEAAEIDGAGKIKQAIHITLPSIMVVILTVLILEMAKVMNLFHSVFVFYNPLVYNVSDVLGTYTYRVGLLQGDYDYATAVGLFKSIITTILVLFTSYMSKRIRGESVI